MKVSCLQENLNRGLTLVSRAVPTKTSLQVTQNIKIATDQARLMLSATNLEIAITCWVGANVEAEGAITVPARLLAEFVSSLPGEPVSLAVSGRTLSLKCGRFDAKLSGIEAAEFPPIPKDFEGMKTTISLESIRESIHHVTFAAATEESRPVLTGVLTEFDKDHLTMAAADGFRLAVFKSTLATPVLQKTQVIIPARTLNELVRLLTDEDETIEVAINAQKSQILFRMKNIELVSQLLQGSFPKYSELIPQGYTTRADTDVVEFLRATKMSAIFARDSSGIVRLIITPGKDSTPGKMTVSARAEEKGENLAEVDALVDGEPSKIAFNFRYLVDALSILGQAQVSLEITTASNPGVLRPVGNDKYVYVVMPMFVQW
jgi:DNA polymerase-3 subunit beta